jgi:hypothetical protein
MDFVTDASLWDGIRLVDGIHVHDFTYETDWGDVDEAAAILGRLWGPAAARYMTQRNQSTVAWRLRIQYGQVRK